MYRIPKRELAIGFCAGLLVTQWPASLRGEASVGLKSGRPILVPAPSQDSVTAANKTYRKNVLAMPNKYQVNMSMAHAKFASMRLRRFLLKYG
jgi:hypothetical protein